MPFFINPIDKYHKKYKMIFSAKFINNKQIINL